MPVLATLALAIALLNGALSLPQSPAASSVATASTPAPTRGERAPRFSPGDTIPECSTLRMSWPDPKPASIAADDKREWNVRVQLVATTGATEEGRFDQQETVNGKMDVRYYNDTRRWDEPIAFPAGTEIRLTNTAAADVTSSANPYEWNETRVYTVVTGDPSCIPPSAYPITIDASVLGNVTQCSKVDLSFNGSAPPYNLEIITYNTERAADASQTFPDMSYTEETTFPWVVTYPAGTRFGVRVTGDGNSSALARDYTVVPGSDGGTSCDIPAEHQLSREASEDVPTSAASLELVVGHLWLWRLLGSVALNAVVTAVA